MYGTQMALIFKFNLGIQTAFSGPSVKRKPHGLGSEIDSDRSPNLSYLY